MPMHSTMSSQRPKRAKLGAARVVMPAISAQKRAVSTNRSSDLERGFGTNRSLVKAAGNMAGTLGPRIGERQRRRPTVMGCCELSISAAERGGVAHCGRELPDLLAMPHRVAARAALM